MRDRGNSQRAIRIGVSACLLGERVRYDGGHKRDPFLVDILSPHVSWVPVCPEAELGLGTPRSPIRLERRPGGTRLVMPEKDWDLTAPMREFAERRVREIERLGLSGYILKADSPSCGVRGVRVHDGEVASRNGRGFFAGALLRDLPDLPVEEEGGLLDPERRESFLERVFAHHRLQVFFERRWSLAGLARVHEAQRLLLRSHSDDAFGRIGRLLARRNLGRRALPAAYTREVLKALRRPAKRSRQASVLRHASRSLRKHLKAGERQELTAGIDQFQEGQVPLPTPLRLLWQHIQRLGVPSLLGQIFLDPDRPELKILASEWRAGDNVGERLLPVS